MQEDIEQTKSTAKKIGAGLVVSIVLISLLVGGFAGLAGGFYAAKYMQQQGIAGGSLLGKNPGAVSEDSAVIDVVKKTSPAVVSIIISKDLSVAGNNPQSDFYFSPFFFDPFFQQIPQQQPQQKSGSSSSPQYQETGAGSGFFITPDGLILTNKHVVADTSAKYTVITSSGKQYDAKVVATDPINDLALVKIDIQNAPILRFADSSQIQIGQRVIAIGNSLGEYSNTVTTGIVSGIGRNVTAGGEGTSEQLEGVIQTDAAINPGNSGGPLLNIYGQVIGVNTAIDQQGQLVGFAIPSNDARQAVASYNKNGKIVSPYLGVRYVQITPVIQQQNKLPVDSGALIVTGTDQNGNVTPGVVPGGAADKAGLKNNDIIVSVNGAAVDQNHSLSELIRSYNPGDKIKLDVIRDNKHMTIEVTLGQK